MDITNMDKTTNTTNTSNTDNTSNTKITNTKHCSLCGGIGHNKRSCPTKEIDDTSIRTQANAVDSDSDYEEITISEKKMNLIKDLKIAQDYSIKGDVFVYWLHKNKSCSLKEVKICMDDGLNPEYTKLFIDCTKDFDEYY